jgi:hypothetical protein
VAKILFITSLLLINHILQSQNIKINEIVSSNKSIIADEDGDFSDWIEIINLGEDIINLKDYSLSDSYNNIQKWIFPNYFIFPDEKLIIWASGKDRKHSDQNRHLHTNFSIESSGEEVLLSNPQQQIIDKIDPIFIPSDISYGRYPNGSGSFYFYTTPSPGNANNADGYENYCQYPIFEPKGGIYKAPLKISVNTDLPVYYTTDGNNPSSSSNMYSNKITINNTTQIKAQIIDPNKNISSVVSNSYLIVNESLNDFSSNLPIMIFQDLGTSISEITSDAYIHTINNINEQKNELTGNVEFEGKIKLNYRGSSALYFAKKSFGFHIVDNDDNNLKVPLLGLPEEHNWVLHGPFADKTLMRNELAYYMGNSIGLYSPYTQFVELFLHSGSGDLDKSHYMGVYLLTQRIKVGPGNVDITELETYHNSFPDITGGYIFKNDRLNEGEEGFRTTTGSHFAFVRPNEQTITEPQKNYLISYLDSFETALWGDDLKDIKNGYTQFIDVESFIDMHLITEISKEIDGFRLSTFLYKDREEKLCAGPLWDFNLAFGNANYHDGAIPEGWYHNTISRNCYLKGWYLRMFEDSVFVEKYKQRYRSLRNSKYSNAELINKIYNNSKYLSEAQIRNFERWDVLGTYLWPNEFIGNTYEEEVDWMAQWLEKRLAWMDTQLGKAYTLIHYWDINSKHNFLEPRYTLGNSRIEIIGTPQSYILTDGSSKFLGINSRLNSNVGSHLKINNAKGTQLILQIPTTNYQELYFSYEICRSSKGSNIHYIYYSTNGVDFVPYDTIAIKEKVRQTRISFKNIDSVNNNPDFKIKLVFDNTIYPNDGNIRIDNISLEGEAINQTLTPPIQLRYFSEIYKFIENQKGITIDLSEYFSSSNQLFYDIEISEDNSISTDLTDGVLSISPIIRGGSFVKITVTDSVNPVIERKFYCLVYPEPINLISNNYKFDYWNENSSHGEFPEYTMFLQTLDNKQSSLSANTKHYSYFYPEENKDVEYSQFPYSQTSGSHFRGLNEEGILLTNMDANRQVSNVLIAIDTRFLDDIYLSWEAKTRKQITGTSAIRLQYRIGIDKYWENLKDRKNNYFEYKSESNNSNVTIFEDYLLPDYLMEKKYVQLRWILYDTQTQNIQALSDEIVLNNIQIGQCENSIYSTIYAYPNPNIGGRLYFSEPVTGFIYNSWGVIVKKIENLIDIESDSFSAGVYFIKNIDGKTGIFVKQ